MDQADLAKRGHQNLIEFWRQSALWDKDGQLRENDDVLIFATGSSLASYNGAFRLVQDVTARDLLDQAEDFFLPLGRDYSIKVRDTGDDDDLQAACKERRMVSFGEPGPEMAVWARLPDAPLPPDLELRPVTTEADVADFVRVSGLAYSSYSVPPDEVEALFSRPSGLLASAAVVSVVGYLGGKPVAAAQTLVSHGIGGVYWVGAVDEVRGRGIGEAVSRAVTNISFERGAAASTLQASRMGENMYRRMGYVTLYRYRTYFRVPRRHQPLSTG